MAVPLQIEVGNASNVGRVREHNEDYFAYFEPPAGLEQRGRLFVVADGMGGEAGGDVASRLAVETVRRSYYADGVEHCSQALRRSLEAANAAIYERSCAEPALTGMGTTCTALVLTDAEASVAHVGDTRAYLVRAGVITRLTRDHSLGDLGRPNTLTRALGTEASVEVDLLDPPLPVARGDVFLLCSDGLWGQVPDPDIARTVTRSRAPQRACRELVDIANRRGGPDNITVQMVRIEHGPRPATDGPRWLHGLRRLLGAA